MAQRKNWGLRAAMGLGSVVVFVGFWQAAARAGGSVAAPGGPGSAGSNYAPPTNGSSGLLPATSFPRSPDAGTHVS